MKKTSRLPGFYRLSVGERRHVASAALGLDERDFGSALEEGGLNCATADKTVENVVGVYSLPFALGLNVSLNGDDFVAPMVVEEPSVVAAASNAARLIRGGGGFKAESDPPHMISQVQLDEVADPVSACAALREHRRELMQRANAAVPGLVRRGGGAVDLEIRDLGDGYLVVHFIIDCRDAMGANLVNTVAEKVAERVAEIAQGRIGLRILSNLCDRRCVRVTGEVPPDLLAEGERTGTAVRDAIVRASIFAEKDPYRASTHNKGIFNGIDAVVIATGNDWRAVEAGAHAYAARSGTYSPLCTWRVAENGNLRGSLEIPLALGTVGGPSRVHDGARFGIRIAGVTSSQQLAELAACVGMASNLAALRALATTGIQRGHMALHARSVAIAAGATGKLVERVASEIHALGDVSLTAAENALARLNTAPN